MKRPVHALLLLSVALLGPLSGCGGDGGTTPPPTNTPPVVVIQAPANGSTVSTSTINVTGTATDDGSISKVEYTINGSAVKTATGTGAFAFTATLKQGANTIEVTATDNKGATGKATLSVTYTPPTPGTNQSPVVTITSPQNGSTVTSTSVNVSGTATDDGSIAKVEYSVNGGTLTKANGTGTFGFTATLKQGANTIQVTATDNQGATGKATITITYTPPTPGTNQPPTVTISSPQNGSTSTDNTINVIGTATDDGTISKVEYSVNGGAIGLASGTDNFSFPATLNSGANTIQVTATDDKGATGQTTISVTYTPPVTQGFSISPIYQNGAYFIAQGANALYELTIGNRLGGFNTAGTAFDSLTAEGGIIGTGAGKVSVQYRKDLSSQDKLAFVITANASVPIGSYTVKLTAKSGTTTASTDAKLEVTPCSFGCN